MSRRAVADRTTGALAVSASSSSAGQVSAWAHIGQDVTIQPGTTSIVFFAAPIVQFDTGVHAVFPAYSSAEASAQMVVWRPGGVEVAHPVQQLEQKWTILWPQLNETHSRQASISAVVRRSPAATVETWHVAFALMVVDFAVAGLASANASCTLDRLCAFET
jgi:hypothetical protein